MDGETKTDTCKTCGDPIEEVEYTQFNGIMSEVLDRFWAHSLPKQYTHSASPKEPEQDVETHTCTYSWGDGWSGDHRCMKPQHDIEDDPFHRCACDATKMERKPFVDHAFQPGKFSPNKCQVQLSRYPCPYPREDHKEN